MPDPKVAEVSWAAVHNQIKEISVAEWGGTDGVNCYAFAANCKKPAKGKPDPGGASGFSAKGFDGKYSKELLVAGAVRDGMRLMGGSQVDPPSPSDGHYLVALYLASTSDEYHWYRKDPDNGRWVHKPGPQGIRNFGVGFKVLPTELVLISHDYGSARTNYKFCAFLEVPDAGIVVT